MTEYIRSKPGCKFSEPNEQWCPPLEDNLGNYKTPEGFYLWHKDIWLPKVRPLRGFGPQVFTQHCLMTDPFATQCGRFASSRYFQLLFHFFPDLSGQHFSYAANDNEIHILWGFLTTGGRREILVPANDIFGLKKGLVNYRLSTFDVPTLIRALLIAYAGRELDPFIEGNLEEIMWRWHVDEGFAKAQLAKVQARLPKRPVKT
jgi:hypothetical protein